MTIVERAWRGTRNDWRLHLLSVFSVAVAFVCLAAAVLVVVNVHQIKSRWENLGRLSVYVRAEVEREQVRELEGVLRATPGVSAVRYVSSEMARDELTGAGSDSLLDKMPPEAFPASLEVSLDEGLENERVAAIAAQLQSLPRVDSVETYANWSERLTRLLSGGVTAALILALVVLAAVVSVVSSTIRLTLQRRRVEVEILKLIGATDRYVRQPFLLEGAAQGGLGATLALILLGVLYLVVKSHFDAHLGLVLGVTPQFLPLPVAVGMVAVGAALGGLAALGSLRKLVGV